MHHSSHRELEAGTTRLVWTQSVTRTRWLVTKVAVVGAASMVVAGLLSLIVTWWASPLDRADMQVYSTFDERALVPIGYAALAFALGVTAGVVIRRVLPAMATTLVAFVAARLAFAQLVRPHLASPAVRDYTLQPSDGRLRQLQRWTGQPDCESPEHSEFWSIRPTSSTNPAERSPRSTWLRHARSSIWVRPPGNPIGGSGHVRAIVPEGAQQILQQCFAKVGASYHVVTTCRPPNHYWALQWSELAGYLVAALILLGGSTWWVRRRLS